MNIKEQRISSISRYPYNHEEAILVGMIVGMIVGMM